MIFSDIQKKFELEKTPFDSPTLQVGAEWEICNDAPGPSHASYIIIIMLVY